MKIAVVGTGYVGLVAGACFAETGNEVWCIDIDEAKIEGLRNGVIPIYEPGLETLVKKNAEKKRLHFSTCLKDGVENGEVIFIAVGTPQDEDGSADLRFVLDVAKGIGTHMNGPKIIVDKSTVPVGTAAKVSAVIKEHTSFDFEVVSNPEFLKEGAAIDDFLKPDRVVIGVSSEQAANKMKKLYAPFVRTNNPIIVMDVVSAEMTKYAANSMLATRVSFMNEVALLCEKVGADVQAVRIGIGTDSRIGMPFLFPGIGYGGSCFPKDVQAFIKTGEENDLELKIARAVEDVNARQKMVIVEKIRSFFGDKLSGRHFAIWGLAFKPNTDDVREAPAMVICKELLDRGATLALHDPEANATFQQMFGEHEGLSYSDSNYEVLKNADALILCTEWSSFRQPDFNRMKELLKSPVVFDGRNIFDSAEMADLGFAYSSIGRKSNGIKN